MRGLGLNRLRRIVGLPVPLYVEARKRLAAKYLGTSPIIVDAGAHDGGDSAVMAQFWPKGFVHAFEPVPESYLKLMEQVASFPNVATYQIALSNCVGQATMHVSAGNQRDSSSLLRPTAHLVEHPSVRFDEKVTVKTATLDSWAEGAGVSKVDLLWLDMQGGELQAMQAAPKIMSGVTAVLTEVSFLRLYDGAPLEAEVVGWMLAQGFRTVRRWINGRDSGDVLFVR